MTRPCGRMTSNAPIASRRAMSPRQTSASASGNGCEMSAARETPAPASETPASPASETPARAHPTSHNHEPSSWLPQSVPTEKKMQAPGMPSLLSRWWKRSRLSQSCSDGTPLGCPFPYSELPQRSRTIMNVCKSGKPDKSRFGSSCRRIWWPTSGTDACA